MKKISECHLYGILDLGCIAPPALLATAEKMIEGGVDILQLRAKHSSEKDVRWFARQVVGATRAAGIPLIVNDFPALPPEVGADGVHIGQDDFTPGQARRLAGENALIGKSTHSDGQAVVAQTEGVDYIGYGPLFATPTKPDYPPVGLAGIRRVHELIRVPIFCIGGIKLENLASVLAAGARRIVMVSGILKAADIAAYTREAKALLLQNLHPKS